MNMAGNNVILSFSGRKNGNCFRIARQVQGIIGGDIFSCADLNIAPCGRCDYECFGRGESCPYADDDVRRLYEAVCRSDAAVYILPNYSDFPCANFFVFNERSLCFFSGRQDLLDAYEKVPKKFIVVSSGEPDSFRAALNQHSDRPEILFLSAHAYGRDSIKGDLMEEPEVIAKIEQFLKNERPID